MAKFLLTCPAGIPLLKQLFDYILFAPQLWIHTPAPVCDSLLILELIIINFLQIQTRLYSYLATEFLSNAQFTAATRRSYSVMQMVNALKYYYWVVPPRAPSTYTPKAISKLIKPK